MSASALDPKDLRPLLHAELDRLPEAALDLVHRMLLELEFQQVTDELDDDADQARANGRLTPESVSVAIADYRQKHPYR